MIFFSLSLSPRGRGRRGLGLDRSRDPLRRTHSSCGSDRASPARRRCCASRRRIAPSSWCRRRTWAEQGRTRARLACRREITACRGPSFTYHIHKGRDEDEDDAEYSNQGAVGARLNNLLGNSLHCGWK